MVCAGACCENAKDGTRSDAIRSRLIALRIAAQVPHRHVGHNDVFSQARSESAKEIGRLFQRFCNSSGQRERKNPMTPQAARAAVLASVLFAFAGAAFAVYGWLGSPGVQAR